MKKILAFLVILAMAGPVLGVLCYCCPLAYAKSSEVSIAAPDCSCCQTKDLKRDDSLLGKLENFIPELFRTFLSHFSSSDSDFVRAQSVDSAPRIFGPPYSSGTPLYLATQVLRI